MKTASSEQEPQNPLGDQPTTDETSDASSEAEAEAEARSTSRATDGLIIAALVSGATQAEAGRAAKVSDRTVRRRLESRAFQERLQEAERAFLGQISKRLTGLAPIAVETLGSLMTSPDVTDQVKLRACLGVLSSTHVWREATDLDERLRELEDHVAGSQAELSL